MRLRHLRHNLRVRNGHHAAIYGVLTDTAGLPLANQPIQVSQQLRGPGQVFSAVGQTTTDANGFMRFVAAPGPSRTLNFAFPGNDGNWGIHLTQAAPQRVRVGAALGPP